MVRGAGGGKRGAVEGVGVVAAAKSAIGMYVAVLLAVTYSSAATFITALAVVVALAAVIFAIIIFIDTLLAADVLTIIDSSAAISAAAVPFIAVDGASWDSMGSATLSVSPCYHSNRST